MKDEDFPLNVYNPTEEAKDLLTRYNPTAIVMSLLSQLQACRQTNQINGGHSFTEGSEPIKLTEQERIEKDAIEYEDKNPYDAIFKEPTVVMRIPVSLVAAVQKLLLKKSNNPSPSKNRDNKPPPRKA